MSLLYASESWILSILGWVWLTIQEMGGRSLLSSFVFYGMLFVSTCNLVFAGFCPTVKGPKQAFFSVVVVLTLFGAGCAFDGIETTSIGSTPFEPVVGNATGCSLAKMNRAFYFTSSSMYFLQAGVLVGYLLIHLLIAGAGMLDADSQGVWPGPAWGVALIALAAYRFYVVFDGSAKGASLRPQGFYYFQLFSEPIWTLSSIFLLFFEGALILMALEGAPLPQLSQAKFVRFFVMGFTGVFFFGGCVILAGKGMLTPPTFLILIMSLPAAIVGTIEAVQARPLVYTPPVPSAPPEHLLARSVYNRGAGSGGRQHRNYIPVPVEMIAEKSKAV